jgi:crotonobetainyl-CoA:carnitine CoA-transferase CaiB-like acyl-CoA transferase
VLLQPTLADDERFASNSKRSAHREALRAIILDAFGKLTATEVVERLEQAQIANAQVNTMADVWAHPQLQARGRWTEIDSPAGKLLALLPPGSWQHGAPRMDSVPSLGQHTDAILAELGYSVDHIAGLRAAKAI